MSATIIFEFSRSEESVSPASLEPVTIFASSVSNLSNGDRSSKKRLVGISSR